MKYFVLLLSMAVVLFFATSQLNAQILFQADFSNTSGNNDPAAWNANNVGAGKNVFDVAGGRLLQTTNDCVNSTKTPFPTDGSSWTDYAVAVDIWDKDNDAFSILFRYTDANNYYNFTIGGGDFDNRWRLGDSTAREDDCFDAASPALAEGENGLTIDESGATAYTMVVSVNGDKIQVFFGEQVDVQSGQLPPLLAEVNDNAHPQGTAGLHFGSNPMDLDNIFVFGPGVAVEPQGKLATAWGQIKSSVY
ncbi:MAG: hypothetical protein ACE1ZS_00235 [Candidatus Poribacteria bacterium]